MEINAGSGSIQGERKATINADDSLTFTGGQYSNTANTSYVIPISIYGIKEVV
jgi:hypothetical protein